MASLEQQLDALIAEHRLSSITLSRIASGDHMFWSVNAQGDGFCAGNGFNPEESAGEAIRVSIEGLNAKRTAPVVVPELAEAA